MFKCLVPGCIGIDLPWDEWPALAAAAGFDAVDIHPLDLGRSASQYRDALAKHHVLPGGAGLPVQFRKSEEEFESSLALLDAKAALAAEIGCTRFYTWILPASDTLPFEENYRMRAERLGKAAAILADHGCRLGLEFVGPKTSRAGKKFEFIHTLGGMMELAHDVGENAGLLLDSWHWYTSHGTLSDLAALTDDDIVYVHVNDAPEDIDVDEQLDNVRCLPGATGVQDIKGFMAALREIDYTGPVTPEPFDKSLAELPPAEAARRAADAMNLIWKP
jgi:sugar phosphate isomerase/epimerase